MTCCAISGRQRKDRTDLNGALKGFLAGLFLIVFFDMAIYYCNYVIGIFNSLEVMRMGNCLIALLIFLWVTLQEKIIYREALRHIDFVVRAYMIIYGAVWLLLNLVLDSDSFSTMRWLLLVSDILLMTAFLTSSLTHIIYAVAAELKRDVYYMIVVTSFILWNFISYTWSQISVYWGNSRFIRAPLDLTIVAWLIIGTFTTVYVVKTGFRPSRRKDGDDEEPAPRRSLEECMDSVFSEYKLTPREREIGGLIYGGKSNKEIAEMLFLSESTVKTHIYNIFRKMEVKNRVGVICAVNDELEKLMDLEDNSR